MTNTIDYLQVYRHMEINNMFKLNDVANNVRLGDAADDLIESGEICDEEDETDYEDYEL